MAEQKIMEKINHVPFNDLEKNTENIVNTHEMKTMLKQMRLNAAAEGFFYPYKL